MNLALSNFAFNKETADSIFLELNKADIHQIESILYKINNWDDLNLDDLFEYRSWLRWHLLKPYSIQSLFYDSGCTDINDVGKIIAHFKKIILFAQMLGSKVLVFGSPNLRKKCYNWEINLIKIFRAVDKLLINTDVILVIEPNAKIYGGEFFNDIYEVVEFIKKNKFKHIKTMIDTHNSFLEESNPLIEIVDNFKYIEHIHVSEPGLQIIEETEFHVTFSNKLKEMGYNKVITYEVLWCEEIANSIKIFSEIYH